MPEGKHKSRTLRRVYRKTPGNRVVLHYRVRKPRAAVCGGCGITLKGVPRKLVPKLRNLPKTMRRPTRSYGGYLCSRCAREKIIQEVRKG
jgi:large subunit ribosomal protein L34e